MRGRSPAPFALDESSRNHRQQDVGQTPFYVPTGRGRYVNCQRAQPPV